MKPAREGYVLSGVPLSRPFPFLVLAFLLATSCAHATFDRLGRDVPAALARAKTPGAVVVVVKNGAVVYAQPFGLSSAEAKAPMRVDSMFRIASLTKSFTALATVATAERGALDLQSGIGKYVTGLPPKLASLTLSQLLSHTAGMRDEAATYGPRDPHALEAAARRLTDTDLFTRPGEINSYSNLGYTLAGFVLESAAKRPYAEVVESEVLRPMGMTQSTFDSSVAMTYPLAVGHKNATEVVRPFWDNGEDLARGGLFSTAPELARFAIAVMNGQGMAPNVVRTATTAHADVPGGKMQYGYGFRIDRYRGVRQVGHFGGGMGFGAVLRMLPEKNAAVIVLANRTNALLNDIADEALDLVAFDGTAAVAAPPPVLTNLSPAEAAAYAGSYRNGEDVIELVSKEGSLFMKDDDALLAMRRDGDELVVLDDKGSVVLRLVALENYIHLFGRSFRKQ